MDRGARRDASGEGDERVVQRAFTLVIVLALAGCLVYTGLAWYGDRWAAPVVLEDTINPNTASLASLLRLPGVGPQRAQAIVDYREKVRSQRGGPVFRSLKDIDAVPGLGPTTVQTLAPYLRFSDP
jgi:competence protein ComEA